MMHKPFFSSILKAVHGQTAFIWIQMTVHLKQCHKPSIPLPKPLTDTHVFMNYGIIFPVQVISSHQRKTDCAETNLFFTVPLIARLINRRGIAERGRKCRKRSGVSFLSSISFPRLLPWLSAWQRPPPWASKTWSLTPVPPLSLQMARAAGKSSQFSVFVDYSCGMNAVKWIHIHF